MKRFNLRASLDDMYEDPEGEFVEFEAHERELARYKGAVEDWASKWQSTENELVAHKAMSKLVIEQLGASMQAAAERMTKMVDCLREVQLDHSRALIDIGEELSGRIAELIGPHPRDGQ